MLSVGAADSNNVIRVGGSSEPVRVQFSERGKDGYTPVKGKDYFDGKDGSDATVTKAKVLQVLGFIESEDYPGCFYRMYDEEIEWINPPLVIGEEYRTIERYNGSAVYIKLVDCGALANRSTVNVDIGVAGERAFDVSFDFHMGSGNFSVFPYVNTNFSVVTRMYINTSGIMVLETNADLSAYTAKATIKYTKS